jgi:hypothetical protein
MRLRVHFDSRLKLGDLSKVLVPVPMSIITVGDLVEYLCDWYDIAGELRTSLAVSIDEFLITSDQVVRDIIQNDDILYVHIRRASGPGTPRGPQDKRLLSEPDEDDERPPKLQKHTEESTLTKTEDIFEKVNDPSSTPIGDSGSPVVLPKVSEDPFYTPLTIIEEDSPQQATPDMKPGDEIKFMEIGKDAFTHAIVREVVELPDSGQRVVSFTNDRGSWDSLEISAMNNLEVVLPKTKSANSDEDDFQLFIHPGIKTDPGPDVKYEPDEDTLKCADKWRERQRSKNEFALRRQIEWFVINEGPKSVSDILTESRITDLTDTETDIVEAIKMSKKVRIDIASNTILPL